MGMKPLPLDLRVRRSVAVDPETGCWLWQLHVDRDGYGVIKVKGMPRAAHRISFEAFKGAIPDGMQVDHVCRNRSCVNPEHLRAVDSRTNTFAPGSEATAAVNSAKVRCPRGHEYAWYQGRRVCRPCRAEASARWRARQKAAR